MVLQVEHQQHEGLRPVAAERASVRRVGGDEERTELVDHVEADDADRDDDEDDHRTGHVLARVVQQPVEGHHDEHEKGRLHEVGHEAVADEGGLGQDVGDLRIRLRPRRVKGRTVIPLTREADGMQAWKILIPRSKVDPEPRSHDGYEWLYVLSGRMRLILGDHDLVLGPGEVAQFDTLVPHWFGSTGDGPVEVLSLFGRHGEHLHLHDATGLPR